MAIKKSELYSSIWQSCDELRGGMDASQYKDYVLVLLFVKYVSDKYAGQRNALLEVPKGGSFADIVVLKGDKEIGEKMMKIIVKLAEANNLRGVIDVADFNDPEKLGKDQEMVDRLSKLVAIFDNPALDFRGNRAEGDDILGDAYEFLMRHFATESGKSKGQFYTPSEVSRIIAKVIGIVGATRADQTIYDPTCGSGSLLLKAHDEAKVDVSVYGQEKDGPTTALCKMNMILHNCPTAEIAPAGSSTLANPFFRSGNGSLKAFDFVVANPPFSYKAWKNGFNPQEDEFDRFAFGLPPPKNGDYAFLLHILASLKSAGKGAVILPHGVLFRGNAEAEIRRKLVERGYIRGIIGLPANLFYGTGIPACIIVLDKENAGARKGIFMIDASKGFKKDGNKNRLRDQDIHKIVDAFTRQLEIPCYSRMVPTLEIAGKDFSLNLPRYIDSSEEEDLQDINAHLRGGIPNRDVDSLAPYWEVFPALRATLFKSGNRPGYTELKVAAGEINAAIFGHPEFTAFNQKATALFTQWNKVNAPYLKCIKIGGYPKVLIEKLSEDLLETFGKIPLLDAYDVYQHLMDYWAETMQDDCYLLVQFGWKEAAKPRLIADSKDKKSKEAPDFTLGRQKYKSDLVSADLMVSRFFAIERLAIDKLENARDSIVGQLEEMEGEQGREDGLLSEAKTEKGKLTKVSVTARIREIRDDVDAAEERNALLAYAALLEELSANADKVNDAKLALEVQVASKYGKLTEDEIKILVVDGKWIASLGAAVQSELDRVSQKLSSRIRELAERYASPLPKLTIEVEVLAARVAKHLKTMGAI